MREDGIDIWFLYHVGRVWWEMKACFFLNIFIFWTPTKPLQRSGEV